MNLKKLAITLGVLLYFTLSPQIVSAEANCTLTLSPNDNIQTALSSAGPGTTICLEGGTYTGQRLTMSNSGSATAPITLRSKTANNRAVIDCSNCSFPPGGDGKSYGSILHITGSYITVQDVTIQNTGRFDILYKHADIDDSVKGITVDKGKHIKLLNLVVDKIVGYCLLTEVADTVEINGGTYSNCNLENHPDVRAAHPDPEWSWNWGSGLSIARASTNVAVRNITHYNSWGEGINFWSGSNNGIIEGNTVYNVWGPAIYLDRARDMTVRNNTIHAVKMSDGAITRPIEVMNEAGAENHVTERYPRFDNIKIYNNLVVADANAVNRYGEKAACINIGDFDGLQIQGNLIFANNTCIGTRSGKNSAADPQNIQYKNNLYISAPQPGEYASGAQLSYNAWSTNIDATAIVNYKGAGNIFGMTSFPYANMTVPAGPLNPADFKLTAANFDHINKGTDALSSTDILGCPRVGAPDIGAFEYNPDCSGTTPPPPDPTPTPTATPRPQPQGDFNNDYCVDYRDYNIFIAHFGATLGEEVFVYLPEADFNLNNTIDIFDYNRLLQQFGLGCHTTL